MLCETGCATPFKRLIVDHSIRGNTRVQWVLDTTFGESLPHSFQLQASMSGGPTSADWVNVGTPVINGIMAVDDQQRLYGKRLLTHYRVLLTTPGGTVYASSAAPVYGELDQQDWVLAREILRKEELRHKRVSRAGYLVKRMRYGVRCGLCTDSLTDECMDGNCPECNGTGFQVGYHAPIPMQRWDLDPETITEDLDHSMRGTVRDDMVKARLTGCIQVNKYDLWVDGKNDQRWVVHKVEHKAEIRGVPIVVEVTLRLEPYTSPVYLIEVGGEDASLPGPVLPIIGTGSVEVNHDYGGVDALAFVMPVPSEYCNGSEVEAGVLGADVKVFTQADFDADLTTDDRIVARTSIMANGRWAETLMLDPGNYALCFEKPGVVERTCVTLTVVSPSSSSSEQFWV